MTVWDFGVKSKASAVNVCVYLCINAFASRVSCVLFTREEKKALEATQRIHSVF